MFAVSQKYFNTSLFWSVFGHLTESLVILHPDNHYRLLPVWKGPQGSSGPCWQKHSLDEMAYHPVQLNLKCPMLGNPPLPT